MSKISRIYLKTGIGFLVLFIASVVTITWIQTMNNQEDMQRVFTNSIEMGNNVVNDVKSYSENKFSTNVLMWSINGYMNRFVGDSWSNHYIYSSVLLLDQCHLVSVISSQWLDFQQGGLTIFSNYFKIKVDR